MKRPTNEQIMNSLDYGGRDPGPAVQRLMRRPRAAVRPPARRVEGIDMVALFRDAFASVKRRKI